MKQLLLEPLPSAVIAFIIGIAICSTSTFINGSYGFFDSPTPILLGIALTATWWTILHAYHEAQRIGKGIRPDHTSRAFQRTGLAGLLAAVPALTMDRPFLILFAGIFYILALVYWCFDPALNLFRNYWVFYVSDEPRAAVSDKIWRKIPGDLRVWSMLLTKLALLAASTVVYFRSML